MPEFVTLLVKSVHQGVVDQTIQFDSSATVQELKEKIHKDHPDKPFIADQRLIYFGQLLDDSLSVGIALKYPPENNVHTIHLAYPSPIRSSTLTADCNTMAAPENNTDGVRRRNTGNDGMPLMGQMYNSGTFMSQMPASQALADPTQQMAALQQMFNQYMTSYMQYMQTNAAAFQTMQRPVMSADNTPPTQETNAPVQPDVEPPNEGRNPPAPANEPGRVIVGEGDDEGAPHDWLDHVYWFIHLAVLLAIIHFHSNFSRLFLVIIVGLVIYLYQSGFFTFAQRDRAPQPERPEAPRPQIPINDVDQTPDVAASPENAAPAPPQTPDRSALSLFYTFLTTFFTSLIPENNPPIAI